MHRVQPSRRKRRYCFGIPTCAFASSDTRIRRAPTNTIWRSVFAARPGKVLLHGHCHQKSVLGMAADETLLRKMGLDCQLPDSG